MSTVLARNSRHLDAATTTKSTALASTVLTVATTEGGTSRSELLVFFTVTHVRATGLFLVRRRNNLGRQRQVLAEVFDTFVRQVAVVALPGERDAHVSTTLQRLHQHEDFQVAGTLNVGVRSRAGVLFDNENSLLEEVAEGSDAIFLGDEHGNVLTVVFIGKTRNALNL